MRLPGRSVPVVVIVVVLAAIGALFWRLETPTAPPPTAQGASADTLEQVRDVLRQRAARLAAGDVDGFLRPLGPAARAFEQTIARGAASVPLAEIDIALKPGPAVPNDAPSFHAVPVEFVYRYRGLPADNVFRFSLTYDIDRRAGSWVITASSATPAQQAQLPIWATGPVRTLHSAHFLALCRSSTPLADRSLALAEEARAHLVNELPMVIDDVQLVVIARDQADFDQIAGKTLDRGILAFASYDFNGSAASGRRITVNLASLFGPGSVSEHGTDLTPPEVLQHELGHLALTRYLSPGVPGWVNEGAAMFLSGERRVLSWQLGLADGAFDRLSFNDLSALETLTGAGGYAYANAAVLYLVQTFGADRFFEFYRSYRDQNATLGTEATNNLLLRSYGLDGPTLDLRTRAWMRTAAAAG